MTCPTCLPWCATSEEQLAVRLANMGNTEDPKVHRCPHCGGTDWATSRERIDTENAKLVRRGFALIAEEKRYYWITIIFAICAIGTSIYIGPTWGTMLACFIGGSGLTLSMFIIRIGIPMQRKFWTMAQQFDTVRLQFERLQKINDDLMELASAAPPLQPPDGSVH